MGKKVKLICESCGAPLEKENGLYICKHCETKFENEQSSTNSVEETELKQTPETVKEEVVEQKVDEPYTSSPEKIKVAKYIFSLSIFLLTLMALRMLFSLRQIGDIFVLLRESNKDLQTIGVLALVELVLMILNFAIALAYFAYALKYKKSVNGNEEKFKSIKTFEILSLIMSIVFTIFIVFEVFAVAKMMAIYKAYEVETNGVSYGSLVWSGLFAVFAWYGYKLLRKNK